MKSTTIKQLIENYIHQQNSNKNFTIKKLPTQTNQNKKIYYQNDKNIKNPSTKNRKPRCFNTNKNYFEPNNKKLKSYSRYKNIKNHQNNKKKNLVKLTKPNMNRTICPDGYGNIITKTNDRNLSAPSLNYENNHKKIINKKKKYNIIRLNKADKKIIDENLINKDNYMKHFEFDINSVKDNNINSEINDDKITAVTYNNNNEISNKFLDKHEKNDEYNKLNKDKEEINNNVNIIRKNNLNINNFYKDINNKKFDSNYNSKVDMSTFIKNIETIKSKRETINLLKEQLKAQEYNNKTKLNKTIYFLNLNQTNNNYDNNKNKNKKTNRINLVNKSGFAISNFHNYNKYTVNKNNKNRININKANNIYLNEINNIYKDLTPNKQIDNTMRGNINLSNSTNNKTATISTNISNNNNFGKKINLLNVYTEQNDREKNIIKDNKLLKDEDKLINKSEDNINININTNNNEIININQFNTENNQEEKNIIDINNENTQIYSNRSSNINDKSVHLKTNLINKDNNKNNNIKINHEKNEKQNYIYLQKPNKNKNNNNLSKGINTLPLNIKNKKNSNLQKNNIIKEKKEDKYNIIKKQSKLLNKTNNKKKYIINKNYNTNYNTNNNNDANLVNSRYNTLNSERKNNFYNIAHNKNKNKVNNRDKSYDITNKKKDGILKIKNKNISKSKEKYKKCEDSNLKKKNSYTHSDKNKSVDNTSDRNINIISNKEKNNITKSDLKSKSIFKIGVVCEPGEIVFGEKKTNQDNFFNSVINDDLRFIGVCDGHGDHGHHVSKFLRNYLPKQLEKSIQKLYKKEEINKTILDNEMSGYYNENKNSKTNINPLNNEQNLNNDNNNIFEKIKKVFEKSFSKTDKSLSQYCQNLSKIKKEQSSEEENEESIFDVEYSGSTCVSILLKEKNINKIYIANVGDSRAIIIKELQNKNFIPYQISRDHKPTEKDEAQRVLDYDGEIEKIEDDDGNWNGPLRVWVKGSDGPGLAMTRSFGDEVGASVGVVSVPEVGEYKIKEEDKAIIIASDGLWEYMSNEEVTDVVKNLIEQNNADIIANKLYKESIIKWRLKDQGIDDITIICILLKEN